MNNKVIQRAIERLKNYEVGNPTALDVITRRSFLSSSVKSAVILSVLPNVATAADANPRPHPKEMVLAFDIRRPEHRSFYLESTFSYFHDSWQKYLDGNLPPYSHIPSSEGRIIELFFDTRHNIPRFRLDDGQSQPAIERIGDESCYALGRFATVEYARFCATPPILSTLLCKVLITRIWIER